MNKKYLLSINIVINAESKNMAEDVVSEIIELTHIDELKEYCKEVKSIKNTLEEI